METITIFTPTYNRAYCLSNLYESLIKQTVKDFIWLIIDDGSTDKTSEVVASFKAENKIKIEYFRQKNSGKHVAHNKAVEMTNTELFFCVDSDDLLIPNAIEVIISSYNDVSNENILGMYFRRISKDGRLIANEYPKSITRVGICDLYHKYSFHGDTAIVLKTKLIRDYCFDVFPDEKFVSERVFYNKLNEIAPMALFEDAIYISEYLSDGYTKNTERLMIENPKGTALDFLSESFYAYKLLYKMKSYSQFLAIKKVFQIGNKEISFNKKISLIVKLFGYFFIFHYVKLFKSLKKKYE